MRSGAEGLRWFGRVRLCSVLAYVHVLALPRSLIPAEVFEFDPLRSTDVDTRV